MKATNMAVQPENGGKKTLSGIEQLQQKLGEEIAKRSAHYHYDDLLALTGVGCIHHHRANPVRDQNGKIDVAATFAKAGVSREDTTFLSLMEGF